MAAGPPKPSRAGGVLNSLHQAEVQRAAQILGLRGWRLQGKWDSRRTSGSEGGCCTHAEIDLGGKPARQRTAVGKIWAATGVKGNSGEGG